MPSINDIMKLAEALEQSPVVAAQDRCVAVRNRNAKCRKCVEACPREAIAIEANELTLDASACVGCGLCVAACPTEAFVALQLPDAEVRERAFRSIRANGGRAVIACSRIASKRQADPGSYAEVPCLSRFAEPLACELAAQGATSVLLVDGNCATCKLADCAAALDGVLVRIGALLGVHGKALAFERVTGFPEEMRSARAEESRGSMRRRLFSEAAGAAKETAKTAALTTLENELGYKIGDKPIGERLRVGEDGRLPLVRVKRHEAVLNALYTLDVPESGEIESRLFGSVDVNVGKCNSCAMCATFCPTGALSRDVPKKRTDRLRYLEFSASDCVQCGLCSDICWKGALDLTRSVDASELYDFEPRTFILSRQP